jgi:hypothetical protein
MKANLSKAYIHQGTVYGPGEAEVPDNIDKKTLSPELAEELGAQPKKSEAKKSDKD